MAQYGRLGRIGHRVQTRSGLPVWRTVSPPMTGAAAALPPTCARPPATAAIAAPAPCGDRRRATSKLPVRSKCRTTCAVASISGAAAVTPIPLCTEFCCCGVLRKNLVHRRLPQRKRRVYARNIPARSWTAILTAESLPIERLSFRGARRGFPQSRMTLPVVLLMWS